jgi:hypothetical protein
MRRVLPLIAVLLVGFAPVPFPKASKDEGRTDLDKMRGGWVKVWYSSGGQKRHDGRVVIEFKDDHMTRSLNGADEWVARIDSKTNPRRIDLQGYSDRVERY